MNIKNDKMETLKFKTQVLKDIDLFLNTEIDEDLKKGANLVYWLRDYKNYLKQEKTFNPKFLPIYKQWSIVEVNFGFNVGVELGGRHYAIVLNKKDNKNNHSLLVLPLSSMKENKSVNDLRKNEVYLGNEIYNALNTKINELKINIISEDNKKIKILDDYYNKFSKLKKGSFANVSQIKTISKLRISNPIKIDDFLYNVEIPNVLKEKILKNIQNFIF